MKNIGVIVTVIITMAGVLIGYGQLQAKAEGNKKNIEKVEENSEENEEDINELEKYGVQQTMLINQALEQIKKNSELIEKIKEK